MESENNSVEKGPENTNNQVRESGSNKEQQQQPMELPSEPETRREEISSGAERQEISSGVERQEGPSSESINQTLLNQQQNNQNATSDQETRQAVDSLPPLPKKIIASATENESITIPSNAAATPFRVAETISTPSRVAEETLLQNNTENLRNNTATNPQQPTITDIHPRQEMTQDEELEDNEDVAVIMDPNHPLLERVQKAIYDQLNKHEQKLILEVREKEEMAQKEVKRREDAGVELYTLQQNLARLQATFEGAEENYGVIKALREDAERVLKHAKSDYDKEQDKLNQQNKNCTLHT